MSNAVSEQIGLTGKKKNSNHGGLGFTSPVAKLNHQKKKTQAITNSLGKKLFPSDKNSFTKKVLLMNSGNKCSFCEKKFGCKELLYYHLKDFHSEECIEYFVI